MTARSIAAAALLTAFGVAVVACAGARKPSAPGVADGGMQPALPPEIQDIGMMMSEIRQWRVKMELSPSPLESNVIQFRRLPLSKAMICTEEEHATEGTCGEVCTLATHICENAEDICRIAADLRSNTWANEKCSTAKAACKEAKEKCCGCDESQARGGETDGDPEAKNRFWE